MVDPSRPRIRTVSSREAYRNPWMVLREDAIERPGPEGPRPGIYAVVMKPRAAVVVPWDGERVHLVGQHRYPLDAWSWELPQGASHDAEDGAGSTTDDPAAVARQELREETGFEAGELVRLAELAFAPGMADQRFTAFLARDLRPGPPQPEAEEQGLLVPRAVTPAELDAMIDAGEVVDAATIATWLLALRRGLDA